MHSTSTTSPTTSPAMPNEKRNFSGISMSSNKSNGSSHFPQKLKNFFRINASNHHGEKDNSQKTSFRQSKFFPSTGRNRSTTVASEGNAMDDVSPTATANPYFTHQGLPALRHHNAGSVPPSPPDTPVVKVDGAAAGKEELARKLRRVASAPNAQGLFSKKVNGERPATAELGKISPADSPAATSLTIASTSLGGNLEIPTQDELGTLYSPSVRNPMSYKRTYSSNSIKVRNVEVGPGSFDKIKLIGKGDVGKVYLVREKKTSRLYAMKGISFFQNLNYEADMLQCSAKRR